MQYHYVIGYNTETKRWFLEYDTTTYFPYGNLWSGENVEATGWGWVYPGDDNPEHEVLDQTLLNTLDSMLAIIPIPQEEQ